LTAHEGYSEGQVAEMMTQNRWRLLSLKQGASSLALLAVAVAGSAHAGTNAATDPAPAPAVGPETPGLGEITVTAERREVSLQRRPSRSPPSPPIS
jgi:hypothetical protein